MKSSNRIIKFRAWDKTYKDIKEVESINFASNECVLGIAYEQRTLYFPRDCEIMQFTGLLDRHGKEIYEGDILQIEAVNHVMVNVVCEFGIARRKMLSGYEVDIPSFYFKRSDLLSFPITNNWNHKHDLEMIEVIGNIYENPELVNIGDRKGEEI